MANTKKYLSHLLQNTGITPACSEEERAAADVIAKIFSDHGFAPEVQEFSASGSAKVVQAGLGIAVFVGAVLAGIGGPAGIVGLLLAVAAAVLFVLERSGRPVLSNLGSGGLSQNVIAYHEATGPLASPRNRPVVVVAHYDSPRADLLSSEPFAAYRPLIVKLLPACMVAPAIFAIVRVLPLPDPAKVVLWVLAIVAALIPLANGIAIIANRFFLPYTTGAVCNKSSVAAMLGVMDAVAPYEMGEEFPSDQPADEYFAEQQRILEEAIAAAEAAAAAQASYPHEMEEGAEDELTVEGAEGEQPEDEDAVEAVDFGSTSTMNAAELEAGMTAVNLAEADPADEDVDVEGVVVEEEPVEQGTAVFEIVESDHTAVVNAESAEEAPVDEAAVEQVVANELPEDEMGQVELDLDVAAEDEPPFRVNSEGNIRFGADVIRALGMMPESCSFVYESDAPAASVVVPAPEFVEPEPIEAEESAPVAIEEVAEERRRRLSRKTFSSPSMRLRTMPLSSRRSRPSRRMTISSRPSMRSSRRSPLRRMRRLSPNLRLRLTSPRSSSLRLGTMAPRMTPSTPVPTWRILLIPMSLPLPMTTFLQSKTPLSPPPRTDRSRRLPPTVRRRCSPCPRRRARSIFPVPWPCPRSRSKRSTRLWPRSTVPSPPVPSV